MSDAMSPIFDVCIVGGGVMGAATAWALSKAGKSVVLLERFSEANTFGGSHGDSRIYRCAYADPLKALMGRVSGDLWTELESDSGRSVLYRGSGSLSVYPKGHADLAKLAAAYDQIGVSYERMDPDAVAHRFPQWNIRPHRRTGELYEAIFQPDGGVVFASEAVRAFHSAAVAFGADVRFHSRVVSIDRAPDVITLMTERSPSEFELANSSPGWKAPPPTTVRAKRLVLACGSRTGDALRTAHLPALPLYASNEQALYFLPRGAKPTAGAREASASEAAVKYTCDVMPTFITEGLDKLNPRLPDLLYGIGNVPPSLCPRDSVPGVKVGTHWNGQRVHPDSGRRQLGTDPKLLAQAQEFVRQFLPGLDPTRYTTLRCMYSMTPDLEFVVGKLPADDRVVVLGGFCGEGFKFAPLIGQIARDLSTDKSPSVDISRFSPARFGSAVDNDGGDAISKL